MAITPLVKLGLLYLKAKGCQLFSIVIKKGLIIDPKR